MMKFIADFHVHSHFSIATSSRLVPEWLDYWARLKGITVVGTGDFTHPGWLQELKEKLEPAEPGLFRLRERFRKGELAAFPRALERTVRFMLTGEISSIYKKNGRVRKVHSLLFAPDWGTVEKLQRELKALKGNITSDGRPILRIDSRELLKLALDVSGGSIFFVPAHIWTPWFSVLGGKSGFDSIEECFEDLSPYIYAVETGLSSDPPMNRMCRFLDRYTLISNSDAHSPEKIGREANLFEAELSYGSILKAIQEGTSSRFLGTLEFFPQEGKYHFDGHRKCAIRLHPDEAIRLGGICPTCGKPLTIGVLNRVLQLKDVKEGNGGELRHPFHTLIPIREIMAEILRTGPEAKKVDEFHSHLLKELGPELPILIDAPIDEIRRAGGDELAEGVSRMRRGEVLIEEGYDGEYGRIRVFAENEGGRDWNPQMGGEENARGARRFSAETSERNLKKKHFDI